MVTVVVSVDAAVLESVVVVVGVAVLAGVEVVAGVAALAGVGMVVVVVTCHTSTAGSVGCDGGTVSVSCSSSEARNFAIAFCAPSGNGPDQVSAQFCSMQASCVSIFFDCVHIFFRQCKCGRVCICVSSCGCSNGCEMFFVFANVSRGFPPDVVHFFWNAGNQQKNGLIVIAISMALVLWDSGTLVL
jgi:hypothetical protein